MQTDPDFEVIVADNGASEENHRMVVDMQDERFRYIDTAQHATTPAWDCYWSAEWVVEHEAKGGWYCFPSDDSYYMPVFQDTCINLARKKDLQLVFPEMVYDRRMHGKYAPLNAGPYASGIDKTGFFIRRDVWIGFPTKNAEGESRSSNADAQMLMEVVKRGARWAKVDEILAVHN